jgi:hypothetical protein
LTRLTIVNAEDDISLNTTRDGLEYHRNMYIDFKQAEFDLGGEPSRFSWREMPGLFPQTTINLNKVRALPTQLNNKIDDWTVTLDDKRTTFDNYVVADDQIVSIMILHRGKIVYQRFKTHGPLDRPMTWSVTKMFTSTALARLEALVKVDIRAPIKNYLPEFSDSA